MKYTHSRLLWGCFILRVLHSAVRACVRFSVAAHENAVRELHCAVHVFHSASRRMQDTHSSLLCVYFISIAGCCACHSCSLQSGVRVFHALVLLCKFRVQQQRMKYTKARQNEIHGRACISFCHACMYFILWCSKRKLHHTNREWSQHSADTHSRMQWEWNTRTAHCTAALLLLVLLHIYKYTYIYMVKEIYTTPTENEANTQQTRYIYINIYILASTKCNCETAFCQTSPIWVGLSRGRDDAHVYMYICTYIHAICYMYVYVYTYMYIYIYIYMYIYTCTCMYIRMYIYIYICIYETIRIY